MSPYLTIPEVAALLRVSTRTVRRWISDGALKASRVKEDGSSKVLVLKSDAIAMLTDAR